MAGISLFLSLALATPRGQDEGNKDRPALVLAIVAHLDASTPTVRVLPITHSQPSHADDAVEIPSGTKRRLGLDDERSWRVLTESNRLVWPGPDVRPQDSDRAILALCRRQFFNEVNGCLSNWRERRGTWRARSE